MSRLPRFAAGAAAVGLFTACGQLSGLSGYADGDRTADGGPSVDAAQTQLRDGAGGMTSPDAAQSHDATTGLDAPSGVPDATSVASDGPGSDATDLDGAPEDDASAVSDALGGSDASDATPAEAGCGAGLLACDGGCVNPSSSLNCGSCGNVCGDGLPLCEGSGGTFACTTSCTAGAPSLCGNTCVDEQTDSNNCNACSHVCPGVTNGQPSCAAGACTFTCNSGYTACGGACVDEQTDVNHCNSCSTVCPAVANGQAVCVGGTCTATCGAGFTLCNGACVTLTTTTNCGSCGQACSGGTPFCLGSGSTYACGGSFGGTYSDVDTNACSAIAQTCNTGVYLGNPLDGNACGCPPGYSTSAAMNLMNDQAGGDCGNGIWGWASMFACYAGTSATITSANDFGGFYQTTASNCATPTPAQSCAVGNPLVSGSGCSCPTGAGWRTITMPVDGTNWGQGTIDFCWNSSAALTTFGGAYEGTDPGTGYGGATSTTGGCLVGNPAVSGTTCNCPSGTSALSVRSIYGTPHSGCGNSGQDGSHIFVCIK